MHTLKNFLICYRRSHLLLFLWGYKVFLSARRCISFCNNNIFSLSQEEATNPWGVHVDRVEIKDVRLPKQLQRAMAAEAEATREARAKVIAAEGEQKSSKALKEAADIIAMSPAALQLRYLQVKTCS